MEQKSELIFTVMVTFPELLEEQIKSHNKDYGTDFEIVEVLEDEVPFCKVRVTKYTISDIFDLGGGLAVLQYSLRQKGEIDW